MKATTLEEMHQRLTAALAPTFLEISDDSEAHRGHPGPEEGAGHYTITLASPAFAQKNRVQSHQLVYAALGDMIGPRIHAVRILIRE